MSKEYLQLQNEINKIDNQILLLLKKRFKFVDRIKKFKLSRGMPQEDRQRESSIINKAGKTGLSKQFVKKLFSIIFSESKKSQK